MDEEVNVALSMSQCIPVVGLGLFWATSFSFSDAAFLLSSAELSSGTLFLPMSTFSLMVFSVLLAFADRRFPWVFESRTGFVGASTCVSGIGVFILFASVARGGLPWLTAAGSILMGYGAAVAMVAWGLYMSRLTPTRSSLVIASGFFVGIILTALKELLPSDALTICDISIYAFCGLVWHCAMRDVPHVRADECTDGWIKEVPWRTFAMFAVCSLAGCVVEAIGFANTAGSSPNSVYYVVLGAVILLAVVVWIVVLKRSNFGSLWPFFVLLLIACLMMLPVAGAMRTEQVLGWISAENWCLQALCWILLAATARERSIRPVPLFGICFPLMISAPYCIGHAVAWSLRLPVESSSTLATIMAFVTMVAIVLALFDGKMFGTRAETSSSTEDSFREALQRIGERAGLSPREVDVAYLLARGHTLSKVGDELHISMNTVRSHSRKIYQKLEIHTKQELIEMIEFEIGGTLAGVRFDDGANAGGML